MQRGVRGVRGVGVCGDALGYGGEKEGIVYIVVEVKVLSCILFFFSLSVYFIVSLFLGTRMLYAA